MGISHWLKAGMMCLALIGVILVMRKLNQTPGSMAVSRERTAKMIEGINLCPTRVTKVESSEVSVFEDGMNWFRRAGETKERLDAVAVEKWFSENCTFTAEPQPTPAPGAERTTIATVTFVSGAPAVLSQTGQGIYEWMGHAFTSAQLDRALGNLRALPIAK